jgi:hypothetical protein
VLAGGFAPFPFFSIARFISQGVFAEGALLLLGLAVLHWRAGLKRRAVLPLALLAALLGAYWEAYHHGPYDLQVRRHAVDLRADPAAAPLGRFTLLHLSDVQTHAIRGYEERALARAQALRPDLIVFTGDYVQPRTGTSYVQAFADFNALLRRLDLWPPLGAFALAGDTEQEDWRGLFAGTRFRCLENEAVTVSLPGGRKLRLTGLALRQSRGRSGDLAAVLPAPVEGELRIVAGHSPDFVRALPREQTVHLALAGHTHGGQVVLPFIGPPVTLSRLPNRYAGGLHRYADTWLHVSRGLGMERLTAPQVRFLCPPELTLLEAAY